jgi:colanic acid biosynthesis glycosyl transferase WcaI
MPSVCILYHFFHPDDVVSARHFSDLAEGIAAAGWDVEVLPSNRACRNNAVRYPAREDWHGIRIHRVWRPAWNQSSGLGRLLNALWMLAAWSRLALRPRARRPDVVLVGTDPVLSVLVALPLKWLRPQIKVAHWAFDLYPEAAVAEGLLSPSGLGTRIARAFLRRAYNRCDLIADLGPCMQQRLRTYGNRLPLRTIVPWALSEQPVSQSGNAAAVRRRIFGDTKLALLYSGNLGRAHSFQEFLALARQTRSTGIQFRWSVRGNAVAGLKQAIDPADTNVALLPFVEEAELAVHLAAADIHMASLKPDWSGIVVPSKFFGSLAAGRPILFAGPEDCSVARWIRQHRVGWVLTGDNLEEVSAWLNHLAASPELLTELQTRCQTVYHNHFCRDKMVGMWVRELERLASPAARQARTAQIGIL